MNTMEHPMEPKTEIVAHEAAAMSPLLHLAVEKGVSVEALEKLVNLHERMADREAAKEFSAAMARFQERCPPISKTSTAEVATKSGGRYAYRYAELDEIARTVRPHLHKEGLSYRWDSVVSDDGARIRVECHLSHENGHSIKATFSSPTEALTGAMSPQQKVAAALTFGRRQSLIEVLGLTTTDNDNDGGAHGQSEPSAPVTREQVEMLESLFDRRGPGTREKVLRHLNVETVEQIPASKYEWLRSDLEAKIKAAGLR
jgi:hypothetical protein